MSLRLNRKYLIELFRPAPYLKGLVFQTPPLMRSQVFADVFLVLFFSLLGWGLVCYWGQVVSPMQSKVEIEFSMGSLLKCTFFSMSRGLLAYVLSLIFSLVWGIWSAKDRVAEKALIPILDVLQSIPVLGFMPGFILLLVGVFPYTNMGLELASILMIFTGQAWNMAFGIYHSIRTVPTEKIESATLYRFTSWQCLRFVELPFATISLVWNSIMSMAGGWFFLMLSEAFQLGSKDFRLPGLGSYMSVAAAEGNVLAMISAVLAMIALIVFLDQFLWRPLVVWSLKFRIEDVSGNELQKTWFLQILKSSVLISFIREGIKWICERVRKRFSHVKIGDQRDLHTRSIARSISLVCLGVLLLGIFIGVFFLVELLKPVTLQQWIHLVKMSGFTFLRVLGCLAIGVSLMVPFGLMIGLSEKWSRFLQPLIQITASFPATLLFPALVWLLKMMGVPMDIGSLVLMLMGTQWYILFNVLAGAKAIPSDLKEVGVGFHLSKRQKYQSLYLPAIFPYLVTGLVTAAGGAWNASIVAEYISYKGQVLITPGLGSAISVAAQEGNIPLLVASILVMSTIVVLLNYQIWLRLYHYSEKRFALNY